jgi:hypothetical protein
MPPLRVLFAAPKAAAMASSSVLLNVSLFDFLIEI